METTLLIHILAGGLGLTSGAIALFATKGEKLHRKSGMVFVYAMLTMCVAGFLITTIRGVAPAVNIPAALLTAYLVTTALTTVQPVRAVEPWLSIGAMLLALGVGLTSLTFAFEAIAAGGKRDGMPAFPFFLFGLVGLLASCYDVVVMRSPALRGAPRLARHLWRMSFALWIAALSFFIGQAKVIPKPIRIMPLLAM
ncbi:MAG TPA: hypothetical protein VE621_01770, partial [Bryobacteraceae bacterium]|nr:hypothetical protein [Bryobacteraceae bacterium]